MFKKNIIFLFIFCLVIGIPSHVVCMEGRSSAKKTEAENPTKPYKQADDSLTDGEESDDSKASVSDDEALSSGSDDEIEDRENQRPCTPAEINYYAALTNFIIRVQASTMPLLLVPSRKKNAAIFDVDDTTLLSSEIRQRLVEKPKPVAFYKRPTTREMLLLYDFFRQSNCAMIFLTARRTSTHKLTERNLSSVGYKKITEFISIPDKTYETKIAPLGHTQKVCEFIAQWKRQKIDRLNQEYNVIAFIDDSDLNIRFAQSVLGTERCFQVPLPVQ